MKVLLAEDDLVTRTVLQASLRRFGYEAVPASDGEEAWRVLSSAEPPRIAILDWNMPFVTGPELCQRLRARKDASYTYVLLLTGRQETADVVAGLDAGADEFVAKPCVPQELLARLKTGERLLGLHTSLQARITELEEARQHVTQLQGMLPICMDCHKIRSDSATWEKIERYIEQRSTARFSHSFCDACLERRYPAEVTP